MKFISIALCFLLSLSALAAPRPAIVPAPASYAESRGCYNLPENIGVKAADGRSAKAADAVVKYLRRCGFKAARASKGAAVSASYDSSMASEAYRLEIGSGGISVTAASDAGLMYAVESLRQLAAASGGCLQACVIDDSPRFDYRGIMLDVSRGFLPLDEVKQIIDAASMLKINNFHFHLTDDNGWRIEIKKYPNLTKTGAWRVHRDEMFPAALNQTDPSEPTPYGGYYTQKELRELVKYAADRHVNIIPEIDMPGHMIAAIASYPELACPVVDKFIGVFPGIGGKDSQIILCAGNENTYTFITDVLREVMDIFPSKYIHLGGDEANKSVWRKCPLCNERIKSEGLHNHEELQAYFMDRINHFVRANGRVAMGWDEVTYGNPKEDMVVFGWQGDGSIAVRDSRKSSRRFVMTPAKVMYLIRYQGPQWFEPFTYFGNNDLHDVYSYEPVGSDWDDSLRANLMGVQASMWTEFCRTPQQVQYQLFPRLIAAADVAWRPEGSADWHAFMPALDNVAALLQNRGITVAPSMFNLSHKVSPAADGRLRASLSCIRPDVETRYSLTDSTFADYRIYTDTLDIDRSATIYAATFRNGKRAGRTLELKLDFSLSTGCSVSSPNCDNGLCDVLTNGLRGSDRKSDFEWAGWHNGNAEFTVDLGQSRAISSVTLGALAHADLCVAAPRCVYVYTSDNGSVYTMQGQLPLTDDLVFHKSARVLNLDCPLNNNTIARYVKFVAINPGCIPDGMAREGSPTWMCFDEIAIN